MTRRPWIQFALTGWVIVGVGASGCNGDALSANVDGGERPGTTTGSDGGANSKKDGRPGTEDASAPRPDHPPPPLPSPETAPFVGGRARLVGLHTNACSNGVPASGNGDRWCAFTMPNKQIGFTDLWVINATKALAGPAPKCDGTDPNCKLLIPPGGSPGNGTQLWTGQPMVGPAFPTVDHFEGDTLIFHALAAENADVYEGPVFAWRPGWDAPKQISQGKKAYSCSAHPSADSFFCIENLSSTDPLQFDLTAGRVGTGAKLVKRIVPGRPGSSASQWRVAFTRDGNTLAFSTGGTTTAEAETLYFAKVDAPDVVTMIRRRVSRWSISADATKVYFLDNYNYDTMGNPAGTLTMMDFPSGANEQTLAPMVAALQVLSDGDVDKGIGFLDNLMGGKARYKMIKDRNMPTVVTTVIGNIGGVVAISRDQRFLYYFKNVNQDNRQTTDAYIVKTDGEQKSCTLTNTLDSDQFGASFSPNGSLVFWADNIDSVDGTGEGWVANPDNCAGRRKFSEKMDFWFLHGNDGMVYSDDAEADYASLKYAPFPGGNSVGEPHLVQRQINRIYAVLPNFEGVVFNIVDSPADRDGLYSFGKVPFAGPIGSAPADGGAPADASAPADGGVSADAGVPADVAPMTPAADASADLTADLSGDTAARSD